MNARNELLDEPRDALTVQQPHAVATQPGPQTHDDMLFLAMQRGYTAEQIGQMMDLRDREHAHIALKAFREHFAEFRGENIIVPKTKSVDRGKAGSFVQAEYHVAASLLSPALSRHGFGFRHDQRFGSRAWKGDDGIERDIGWVWVTCYLEHRAGHAEKLELEGPQGDLSANTATQNMQVTASYLKRQSLLAITGTATGGEDDENKMRRRESEAGPPGDLVQAGRDASLSGMKALTAWWGALTAKQRSDMQKDFAGLRRAAQEADHAGAGHA